MFFHMVACGKPEEFVENSDRGSELSTGARWFHAFFTAFSTRCQGELGIEFQRQSVAFPQALVLLLYKSLVDNLYLAVIRPSQESRGAECSLASARSHS